MGQRPSHARALAERRTNPRAHACRTPSPCSPLSAHMRPPKPPNPFHAKTSFISPSVTPLPSVQ
eukprot:scaffold3454_cov122-Isochrysis_galbana.AAC.2